MRTTLPSPFLDADREHETVFGWPYPGGAAEAVVRVEETLKGARPTMCPYVDKHMREKSVVPVLWPICEVGGDAARACPLWEDAASRLKGPTPEDMLRLYRRAEQEREREPSPR